MNHSAVGRKPGRGDASLEARMNLIVALDDEYNTLMAESPLNIEKLADLANRMEAARLLIRAANIRKEIGVV